jgi:hypothetical protein
MLSFRATGWSLGLTSCSEIAAGLEAILHGWDIEHADGGAPDAEITRERDGYVWSSAVR